MNRVKSSSWCNIMMKFLNDGDELDDHDYKKDDAW